MFFGTVEFLIFAFVFALTLARFGRNHRLRIGVIFAFSLYFYGYWGAAYLPLLLFSGVASFCSAFVVRPTSRHRKAWLIVSTVFILLPLLLFKYTGWIAHSLDGLFLSFNVSLGVEQRFEQLPSYFLVLPLGISFYTFQALSYTFDVYRGRLEPERHLSIYLCYLTMFPQLVAGPIVRAADVLDQLRVIPKVDVHQFNEAWRLISRGFFKKLVVADTLGIFVNDGFANSASDHGGVYWWFVAVAFGWQIYCDFSGYTDIAIGIGLMMGYRFPENFRHPYLATSFRDFWGRWHITLSTWFRDYVYIPLGGNRCGMARHHINLWITMLISGVWHGAAWTFVIWAAIHAAGMSIEILVGGAKEGRPGIIASVVRWLLTFLVVNLAWVFFRAESVEQSMQIAMKMIDFSSFTLSDLNFILSKEMVLLMLALMFASHAWALMIEKWRPQIRLPLSTLVGQFGWSALLAFSLFHMGSSNEFIYFQF